MKPKTTPTKAPPVPDMNLRAGYIAMAADEVREHDANAWIEALIADIADEPGNGA